MDIEIKGSPEIIVRILARLIDFIIILALGELLPRAGVYAGILYTLIGDSLFQAGSVGKRLMRISVVRMEDKKPCSPKESVIRNSTLGMAILVTVIPVVGYVIAGLIIVFEFLMMLGNSEARRLGDLLAGTKVVLME